METANRRVAAYIFNSMDADNITPIQGGMEWYYWDMINKKEGWELVEIYKDLAINGVTPQKNRRKNFRKLIRDALGGKIDLIICRSISRFGRDAVKTIALVRKLRAAGVEVFFELENEWSFDPTYPMILYMYDELLKRKKGVN